jgi:hypothetical protein
MFANVKSIRAIPDEQSIRINVSGNLASTYLTGHNEVVDNEGNHGASAWAWTVELETEKSGWTITHDHLMFTGACLAIPSGASGGHRCLECQSVTCRGSVDTVERRTQICAMCLVSAIDWCCGP